MLGGNGQKETDGGTQGTEPTNANTNGGHAHWTWKRKHEKRWANSDGESRVTRAHALLSSDRAKNFVDVC